VKANAAQKQAWADIKNRWYVESLLKLDATGLLPGARECLLELRRRGVKIALGSASRNAPLILDRLNIASLFDAVVDGSNIIASKPNPEVFLRGARELGVEPGECVVFEDAAVGIIAAKRAGMCAVGVGNPAVLHEADYVVARLRDFVIDEFFTTNATRPAVIARNRTIDFRGKPFYLSDEDIAWVETTHRKMSLEDKVGQLFCLLVDNQKESELDTILDEIKPGGFMLRPRQATEVQGIHRHVQARTTIPLLLAANLEQGGNGIADDGTQFASPLEVAATDDEEQAHRLGLVCGREGCAVGCNWTFAPVVDLDFNFNNPITNTRTFGADAERVLRMARAYMRGVQEYGMAVAVKHWPGDGVDGRDQHLLVSVNTQTANAWDQTFGKVYRGMIEAGAATVMVGHIMLPAYSRQLAPGIKDEDILPASLAPELNFCLLREQLGFNGLIVTDATGQVGFTQLLPRKLAVPKAIAAGCDMFLFTIDLREDVRFMLEGVRSGILSKKRLDEAVQRILALKASLQLHHRQADGTLIPPASALSVLRCEEHRRWARECADKAVTLVKDKQGLLPLTPERHRRILMFVLGDKGGYLDRAGGRARIFKELLEQSGFEVQVFEHANPENQVTKPASAFLEKHDLILYFISLKTASNQTVVRINWGIPFGFDAPRYISEIPTIAVSIDNPYHLQDIPRVKTFINGYTGSESVVAAVVDKLLGRSPFTGINPVDPFCGYWDAHL